MIIFRDQGVLSPELAVVAASIRIEKYRICRLYEILLSQETYRRHASEIKSVLNPNANVDVNSSIARSVLIWMDRIIGRTETRIAHFLVLILKH